MKMLKMCLNWKVLAGLAAVGVGVYLFAPALLAEAIPILLLAACPLSMLLMMWAMQQSQGQGQQTPPRSGRRGRLAAPADARSAPHGSGPRRALELEREETRPAENRSR